MRTRVTPSLVVPLMALLASLLLAGCGDQGGDSAADPAAEEPSSAEAPEVQQDAPVEEAVADLASRLGVDPDDVEVVGAEAVTWDNGALGCPQPGEMYTQVQVAGHRIVLRAQDRTWPYHSGGNRGPFLCENLQPSTPPAEGRSE